MDALSLWVPGRPKTKGSLDFQPGRKCRCCAKCEAYLPGGRAVENVAGSKRWRQLMAYSIERAMREAGGSPLGDGEVGVGATFYLPVTDVTAVRAGDADKLARNLLDALTDASAYKDDVQVSRLWVAKKVARDRGPGVEISATAVSDREG